MLKDADERSARRADRQPDRAGPEPAVRRHPGCVRRDLPAAAGAGHRSGRRLQAVRRGSRRRRLRGPVHAGAGRDWRGVPAAVAGRAALELPGERAADRRRTSTASAPRRTACRSPTSFETLAGLSRIGLRQRLQPLRPHLPGQRPGRAGLPAAAGADRAAEDPQRGWRDGAARLAGHGVAGLRAGPGHALQRLPGRRDQRRAGAGLQLRAGAGGDRATCCSGGCRAG